MNPRTVDLIVALVPVGVVLLFTWWRVVFVLSRTLGRPPAQPPPRHHPTGGAGPSRVD